MEVHCLVGSRLVVHHPLELPSVGGLPVDPLVKHKCHMVDSQPVVVVAAARSLVGDDLLNHSQVPTVGQVD